jgi:Ca-activated chloride channel homolog
MMGTTASAVAGLEGAYGERPVLEDVQVKASIDHLMAEVTVSQRYQNDEDREIEAVYTFPLPMDSTLLSFELEIGDRKLAGAIVEKSAADEIYEDAITDGDMAVLLEQTAPGLYTVSVGNLAPGQRATIRFRYSVLLRWNGDLVRFMLPTTIAPRYGDPTAAGLSPHQSPENTFGSGPSFYLEVAVRGLLKDAIFESPSHEIIIVRNSDQVAIKVDGAAMDRDFVLVARSAKSEASGALVGADLSGNVVLASFRPDITESPDHGHRSVKIVVDCSGSMAGDSIAQARVALERILDGLREKDFFEIIAFGSDQRAMFGRETPVSEVSLAKARQFVAGLEANMGGTEIGAALDAAYSVAGDSELARDIFLISDGEVWQADEIFDKAKNSGNRIFTVGVGSAVAEPFVRGLAEATGGACELVTPREDMATRVHRHFQRMYAPSSTRAVIRWPGGEATNHLEPVYVGDTLHVFQWFAEKPVGAVTLELTLADGRSVNQTAEIQPYTTSVHSSQGPRPSTLARISVARRLHSMENAQAATGLAIEYELMSEWTNYIVVDVLPDGEKATDLPEIRKVPQTHAAGSHGVGSVMHGATQRLREAFSVTSDDWVGPPASPPVEHFSRVFARQLETIDATEFVEMLNAQVPPIPTIRDLELWGLPDQTVGALQALVESGEATSSVVLGFLHAVLKSDAGKSLGRQVRRRILKAFKIEKPSETLTLAATKIFDQWQGKRQTSNTGAK